MVYPSQTTELLPGEKLATSDQRVTKNILFVNVEQFADPRSEDLHFGFRYLVAYVKSKFPQVNFNYRIVNFLDVDKVLKIFQPDIIGLSSVSQEFNVVPALVKKLSACNVPVFLGGVHISFLPHCLPKEATAAILGEGEKTFAELMDAHLRGNLLEELSNIPGLAFWKDGELQITQSRPLIEDLDTIPPPDRTDIKNCEHISIFTSRGCPYHCVFCSATLYWHKIRFHSADYVVNDIETLVKEKGVKAITIIDDLFTVKSDRLVEIITKLEQRNLLGRVKFTANMRANLVSREIAQLLARMGVVSVGMGLESGDNETLQYLKGKSASVDQNTAAINYLKDAGIAVNGTFIIGAPFETREQMLKTYDYIRKSRLDLFNMFLLTPYPGISLWDYAKERGLVSEDMDWSRLDRHGARDIRKAIFLSETLDPQEIVQLYYKFDRLRIWWNFFHIWRHPHPLAKGYLRFAKFVIHDLALRLKRNP